MWEKLCCSSCAEKLNYKTMMSEKAIVHRKLWNETRKKISNFCEWNRRKTCRWIRQTMMQVATVKRIGRYSIFSVALSWRLVECDDWKSNERGCWSDKEDRRINDQQCYVWDIKLLNYRNVTRYSLEKFYTFHTWAKKFLQIPSSTNHSRSLSHAIDFSVPISTLFVCLHRFSPFDCRRGKRGSVAENKRENFSYLRVSIEK